VVLVKQDLSSLLIWSIPLWY